jgi:hypothetical protein
MGWYALPRWGNLRFLGRCPAWYALPRWGKLNNGISDPASMFQRASRSNVSARLRWSQFHHHVFDPMPQRGIAFQRVGAAPLEPIPPPRFDPMPQRGIAYQPRVQTLVLTHKSLVADLPN